MGNLTSAEPGREEIADISLTKAIIGTSMMELIAVAKNETDQPIQDKPSTDYIEPKTFDQAWNHSDPEQRRKWREAIGKEYNDMKKRRVWRLIKRRDMPSGRHFARDLWLVGTAKYPALITQKIILL